MEGARTSAAQVAEVTSESPAEVALDYPAEVASEWAAEVTPESPAEAVRIPHVPKDWGGERSDMFTTHVHVAGRRLSTAFAFKGPAKFKPMTMAELGKNGDQIDRLYTEPADLVVLQHCHEVTAPVRGTMRAYAQRMGDLRLFCIIDGYDTLRLLQAYDKCGLGVQAPTSAVT